MPIRDTIVVAYRYSWPYLGLMTWIPFGSYSKGHIEIIVSYSVSTLRYIQLFLVSFFFNMQV